MIIGDLHIPPRPTPIDYSRIASSYNRFYDNIQDIWTPDAYFSYCNTDGKVIWMKTGKAPIGTYHGHYNVCPPDYVVTDYCIHDSTQKLDYITVGEKKPWDIDTDYQYAFKRDQLFLIPNKIPLDTSGYRIRDDWDLQMESTFFEYCKEHNLPVYYSLGDINACLEFRPNGIPYPDELLEKLNYISATDTHGVHHLFHYNECNWHLSPLCENHPLSEFYDLDRASIRKVLEKQLALPYCEHAHLTVLKSNGRYMLFKGWFTHKGQHRQFKFLRSGYKIPLRLEPNFLSAIPRDTPIRFDTDSISILMDGKTELSRLNLKESIKLENYIILSDTDNGSKWGRADYKVIGQFKNVPIYYLFSKAYPHGVEVYDKTLTYELKEHKGRQRTRLGLQGIPLPKGQWSDADYVKYAQMHQKAEQGEYLEIQRTNPNKEKYLFGDDYFGWITFMKSCTNFTDFINIVKLLGIGEVVCNIIFVKSEFATLRGFLENYSQLPVDSRTRKFLSLIALAVVDIDMQKLRSQLLSEI